METFIQPSIKKRIRHNEKPVAKRFGVYAITCIATGERYVGSASYLTQRFSRHRCDLRRGAHWNARMQEAWLRYGADAFTFTVVEALDSAEGLKAAEQRWIDSANPEFNVHRCATSPLGTAHSQETRRRMSDTHMRYWQRPEASLHKDALRLRQRNQDGTYA